MKGRMRWLAGLGVVALCAISALLGLTAGINLNPDSTVRFVPHWGSLADWVAGSGALAAVGASVYFSWRQRQDLLPQLTVRATTAMMGYGGQQSHALAVALVNSGHAPVEIHGIAITSKNSTEYLDLGPQLSGTVPDVAGFPFVVGSGREVSLLFDWKALCQLRVFIEDHCDSVDTDLQLTVKGAIRSFTIPLDPQIARVEPKLFN